MAYSIIIEYRIDLLDDPIFSMLLYKRLIYIIDIRRVTVDSVNEDPNESDFKLEKEFRSCLVFPHQAIIAIEAKGGSRS